jgi:hypothetical protein
MPAGGVKVIEPSTLTHVGMACLAATVTARGALSGPAAGRGIREGR